MPKVTFTAGKRSRKEVNPDHSFPRHVPLPRAESQHLGFPDGSIICFQKGKPRFPWREDQQTYRGDELGFAWSSMGSEKRNLYDYLKQLLYLNAYLILPRSGRCGSRVAHFSSTEAHIPTIIYSSVHSTSILSSAKNCGL